MMNNENGMKKSSRVEEGGLEGSESNKGFERKRRKIFKPFISLETFKSFECSKL